MLSPEVVADLLLNCVKQALAANTFEDAQVILRGGLNVLDGLEWAGIKDGDQEAEDAEIYT